MHSMRLDGVYPARMADDNINGDLSRRTTVRTAAMPWSPSPSPSVWRKRVHRVGPPEAGQVTSVVRYDADSSFPAHDHPEGEEILVLEGVFTDDRGDWPAGTYLLNPEGYRHAPASRGGCILFVKLRQFPGLNREQVAVDTASLAWQPGDVSGVEVKRLYSQAGFTDAMSIEKWAAGCTPGRREYPAGAEIFVLEGAFSDEAGDYPSGTWMRLPVGASHRPTTKTGCTLYLKTGGHSYLRTE